MLRMSPKWVAGSLRFPSKPSGWLNSLPSSGKDIFLDFGIRKPHTVLVGRSNRPRFVHDLRTLGLRHCRIYIEEGCPRNELYGILGENRILTVDGKVVKALRTSSGKPKSDVNDAFLLRRLATESPEAFREMTALEAEELADEMVYSYYRRVTAVMASLKNHNWSFQRQFGEPSAQVGAAIRALRREKRRVERYFRPMQPQVRAIGIRGLGVITFAAVRVKANPKRFRSLSAYLRYCGLRGEARASGRYNRYVRGLYHQFACDVIMHRDPWFYPLYAEIKAKLRARLPAKPRYATDGMAKNRLATLLAKRLYQALRTAESESGESPRLGLIAANAAGGS